jgi:FkbM family methyltransferase
MDADVAAEMEHDDYRASRFVRDGDVVIDVGAYNGAFAAFVKRHAPGARLVSVEPMPSNFEALRANVGDDVTVEQVAVAGHDGRLQLFDYGPDASACHSIFDLGVKGAVAVEVEAVTLGTLLARHALDHVRLLKLDCQGAEFEIIPATPPEVLQRFDYIAMEVHDAIAKTGEMLGEVPGARQRRAALYRHLRRTHVPIVGGRMDAIQVWARHDLVPREARLRALRADARVQASELSRRVGWPTVYRTSVLARLTAIHYLGAIADFGAIVRGIAQMPRYLRDRRRYQQLAGAEPLQRVNDNPQLHDRRPTTAYDPHYLHQDAWAAREIFARRPERHVDIGSRTTFVAGLAAFVEVVFVDIRPLDAEVPNLTSVAGDVRALPFSNGELESVSCLHVAEHIGLGRYGDELDPGGTRTAARELSRVLAPGGRLLFSLPVGMPRTAFNAHRIHDPLEVVALFPDLELVQFAAVDDQGRFHEAAEPADYVGARWSCGLYAFTRAA